MRTPSPKLPLTGRFLSLALLLARTHREKLQEQKEVGGAEKAKRGQNSGREGARGEVEERTPFLP